MKKLTVYFDQNCSFCINIKNIIQTLDKYELIDFKALSENEVQLKAQDFSGNTYYSHEVLIEISKLIPGINKFSWMFETDAGKKTTQIFYESLNTVRKAHNKLFSSCSNC